MSFSSNSEFEGELHGGYSSRNSRPKKVHVKNLEVALHQNLSSASGNISPLMKTGGSRRKDAGLSSGERIIFAESPSAPGIPIVYRLEEERKSNPDKLNLDRRKLTVCPILESEENLRLLNLQHNNIRKIQHMMLLRRLIFLDLYDNQIEEISGLSCLKCLRVLMLGKNRIRLINNLQDLTLLDVLDLHGNKITKLENLSHLHQLRVLNLAGNELTVVKNLTGLYSLSELNLRRNQIHTVLELDQLPSLQRLFLSFNEIKSYQDICCLGASSSLVDLSLDGNPFYSNNNYKQIILQSITSLRQLDMKRVTDEEKRIAQVIARKEEEKRKESERMSSIKEKRRLAINNAQRQWHKQFNKDSGSMELSPSFEDCKDKQLESKSTSNKLNVDVKEYSSCHLAELDSNVLNLYGPRSLDAMNKNWGDQTANSVETIIFKFINFKEIVPYLGKVHQRFPNLKTLTFERTNITTLNDINALACVNKLNHLVIGDGNHVTNLFCWKQYIIYRLSALKLKSINDTQVTEELIEQGERMFGPLRQIAKYDISSSRTEHLKALARTYNKENESDDMVGLIYQNQDETQEKEDSEVETFATNYIREIQQDSLIVSRRLVYFEKLWPEMLREMVTKCVNEMTNDMEEYCKNSLENIKKSIT